MNDPHVMDVINNLDQVVLFQIPQFCFALTRIDNT